MNLIQRAPQPAHSEVEQAISSAQMTDIASIQVLLQHYAGMGQLLPRSKSDLEKNIGHFRVIKRGQEVLACASLEHFTPELAEVRSLMVKESYKGLGLGATLLRDLMTRAQQNGVKRLMALTYVPDFFHRHGFKTVNKEIFPEKVWGICVNCYKFEHCDEIAVLLNIEPTDTREQAE